jgi:mono/diheme cytochrome c family protein
VRWTHSLLAGCVLTIGGLQLSPALIVFDSNKPEIHEDVIEHYKYGSIGAEDRVGIPYWIWTVLPRVFPEYLPSRPGNGYERFGFIFEPGRQRPIGTSYRERQVPLVGLNCATCHTGTLRDTPGGARRIVLGMPSHQFDLQSYQRFVFRCVRDSRFTADHLWPAMRHANPEFGWLDAITYRWFVIPRTKQQGEKLAAEFSWFDNRPPQGPGRVDTFNPYKVMFGFNMPADQSVGTADLPSLWNQKLRAGMWLHWDGNNNAVTERNKSAAIGAGASDASLDLPAMKRVEDWIWGLAAPRMPAERIDVRRAAAGKQIYQSVCADCHEAGGKRIGRVTPLAEVATDSERVNSFTAALAGKMNTIGNGRPWRFTHFRKTDGYAAMPLDGVWLRAPYLHNGSVPTLRHLLEKEQGRPAVFWRGYDVYDYSDVGFVWSGPEAEQQGFRFDTALQGNSRAGHPYGTDLKPGQKRDLLEYLKTL